MEEKKAMTDIEIFNNRFDELMKEMEELGATDHGYSKDSVITIPGTLYSTFLNLISHVKQSLNTMDTSLEMALRASSQMQNNAAKMTLSLMEQHVSNIKAGATINQAQLDVEDAEQKIQEVK